MVFVSFLNDSSIKCRNTSIALHKKIVPSYSFVRGRVFLFLFFQHVKTVFRQSNSVEPK